MSDLVTLEKQGHIVTITLNRPEKLNALTIEMLDALMAYCDNIEADNEIRAVILTGTGERAFCVGADILAWSALQPVEMWRQWVRTGHRIIDRLASLRQPLICAINGYAFGGGLELALAADLRVMVENTAFAMPEVTIGIIAGWGGTSRLPDLIGSARAKEMLYTGRRIDAATAKQWGLVNRVVASTELMPTAHELAASIAKNAPISVQMTKQLVDSGGGMEGEAMAGAVAAASADGKEGVASFKEKRSPEFTGK